MEGQKNEKLIPLAEAAKIAGYAPEHLNLSARKKKLKAEKLGRNWYTTIADLAAFVAEHDKKGDKKENLDKYLADHPAELSVQEEVAGSEADSRKDGIIFSGKRFFAQAVLVSLAIVFAIIIQSGKIAEKNILDLFQNSNADVVGKLDEGILTGEAKALVLGEEDIKNISVEKIPAAYASENFQAKEIRLGGSTGILSLTEDLGPLEISDVKGESFRKSEDSDAKILVTWNTSKPAKTKITFSKAGGQEEKIFEEKFYDKSHAAILSGADSGNAYHYEISARDKSGNEKKSETFAIYSGAKEASIFDVIAKAANDIFGWTEKMRQASAIKTYLQK